MEKLTLEKFEYYFKNTKKIVTKESFLKAFENFNFSISETIHLKRVKVLENSFEKIHYKILKIDNFSYRYIGNKYRYIGLYQNKTGLYQFKINKENLLSEKELKHEIQKNKVQFIESSFNSYLTEFNNVINNTFFQKNLTDHFKVKKEISKYLKKINASIHFNYLNEVTNINEIRACEKEVGYFSMRYLKNIIKNKEALKLENFIYENYDSDIIKLNKLMFSTFKNENNIKIEQKIREVGINELKNFYKEYPLLIMLFLKMNENSNKKESNIMNNFYENYNENLSFINNVKEFFEVSDVSIEKIKNLSWQKLTPLKNRPIILLSLLRFNIDVSKIETRKEMYSLYIYFNYFHNSPYFEFEEKPNYEKIKKLNLKGDDFNKMKSITKKHNNNQLKDFPNTYFKRDIRVKYKSFQSLLMESRLSSLSLNSLKPNIRINDIDYKTSKSAYGFYIYNKDSLLELSLDYLTLNSIEISLRKQTNFSNDTIQQVIKLIKEEFYRFHNKKFPISKIIDKRFFFDYFFFNDKNKSISMKKYYFCTKFSQKNDKINLEIENYDFNKKVESLLDVI